MTVSTKALLLYLNMRSWNLITAIILKLCFMFVNVIHFHLLNYWVLLQTHKQNEQYREEHY